jgi:hypothetical protein
MRFCRSVHHAGPDPLPGNGQRHRTGDDNVTGIKMPSGGGPLAPLSPSHDRAICWWIDRLLL